MLSLPQHHYTESLFLQASWRQGVMVITSGTHGVEGFPAAQCLLSFPFCVSRVSSVFFLMAWRRTPRDPLMSAKLG